MKTKIASKLSINRETLRTLTDGALLGVAGGQAAPQTKQPTCNTCTIACPTQDVRCVPSLLCPTDFCKPL